MKQVGTFAAPATGDQLLSRPNGPSGDRPYSDVALAARHVVRLSSAPGLRQKVPHLVADSLRPFGAKDTESPQLRVWSHGTEDPRWHPENAGHAANLSHTQYVGGCGIWPRTREDPLLHLTQHDDQPKPLCQCSIRPPQCRWQDSHSVGTLKR